MAAVARFQRLWTPTNAFVVSIAVADFLVAVLLMPFSLHGFMLFACGKIFTAAKKQARWIHAIEHHTGQLQMNLSPTRNDSTRQVQAHMERYPLKKERKAAKTLGLIMGVFLFCWLPFFCTNVVHPLKGYSPLVLEAPLWLGYANSSLNPFLCALFNRKYRHIFLAMLDCVILRRQFRASLDSSHFGRKTDTVVILETISR